MIKDQYIAKHIGVLQITENEWAKIYKEVDKGGSSNAKIARKHGIAPSTLNTRLLTRNTAPTRVALGAPPAMPVSAEDRIATWCADMSHAGFAVTRKRFKAAVAEIASKCGITRVKGGPRYIQNFMRRQQEKLSIKKPKKINAERAAKFNRVSVTKWFVIFKDVIKQYSAVETFNVDDKFFNIEESIPKGVSVFAW